MKLREQIAELVGETDEQGILDYDTTDKILALIEKKLPKRKRDENLSSKGHFWCAVGHNKCLDLMRSRLEVEQVIKGVTND